VFRRILRDAFVIVFRNLETVFKVCGAWFVLQFVLLLVLQVMVGGTPDELPIVADQPAQVSPAQILSNLLLMIVGIVAAASISVAWHRFGLLGEQPNLIHLRVGPIEGQFILKSILIALLLFAVVFPISLVAGFIGGAIHSPVLIAIVLIATAVFLLPHLARLYLVLPAVSVERPIGLKEAHRLGQGLGWPMVGAGVVLFLPFLLVAFGLQYLAQLVDGGGLIALLITIKLALLSILLQIILTVIGISVITAGYRIAMERQNAETQETPSNPV
jgi:hypothetical protein